MPPNINNFGICKMIRAWTLNGLIHSDLQISNKLLLLLYISNSEQ